MKIKEQITRIIGIILIAAGIVAAKYAGGASAVFFIPGIIMLLAKKKTAQQELKRFIATRKLLMQKKYFVIALYDMLSWFGLFFVTAGLGTTMSKKMMNLALSPEVILTLITMLIAYLAALIILSLVIYTVFKGLIWLTILDRKIEWRFFTKMSLLNLAWLALWLIPCIVLALGIKPNYFFYTLTAGIILFIHLTTIAHRDFAKKQMIGHAIKNAFAIGIGKIRIFLLPYAYMMLVYIIIIQMFWLIPGTTKIMVFAGLLVIVFYLSWYRQYMNLILEKNT